VADDAVHRAPIGDFALEMDLRFLAASWSLTRLNWPVSFSRLQPGLSPSFGPSVPANMLAKLLTANRL
jgi:hypothetical protein